MNAMLNQFDPITVLTKFNKIAAASRQVVATDIPTSEIGAMMISRSKPGAAGFECGHDAAADRSELTGLHPGRHTVEKRIAASEAIDRPTANQHQPQLRLRQPSQNLASSSKNAQTDIQECADRRSRKGLFSLKSELRASESRAGARRRSERRRSASDDGRRIQRCASSSKRG